ncbi:hypothetical protein K7H91_16495 [Martelella mediterranea]|nr:hypothetical protein [Martelella mediterranea]
MHDLTGDVGKGGLIAVIGGRERKSGTLYSDALSSANGPAPSYLDMLQHKVETLAAAINKG